MYEVPPTRPSRPDLSPFQWCGLILFLSSAAFFVALYLLSMFL